MADWDVIVLGLGGVGSSAAFHLASSGHRVLGIDQYAPTHSHGSSHGKTRIIRQAYFEHPSYAIVLTRTIGLPPIANQQASAGLLAGIRLPAYRCVVARRVTPSD